VPIALTSAVRMPGVTGDGYHSQDIRRSCQKKCVNVASGRLMLAWKKIGDKSLIVPLDKISSGEQHDLRFGLPVAQCFNNAREEIRDRAGAKVIM